MNVCQQCGAQLLQGQTACPNCGAEFQPAPTEEALTGDAAAGASASEQTYATAENVAPGATAADDAATTADDVSADADASAEAADESAFETEGDRAAAFTTGPGRTATAPAGGGGMSATTKALVVAGVAVVAALGILVWQLKGRSQAINLTSEDMAQLAQSLVPPQGLTQLANSAEDRKELAKQVRQVLAIGQQARAEGYADKPESQRQIEVMHAFVLAQMYSEQQRKAGVTAPDQLVSQQEIENLLKEPGQQQKFDQFVQDVQALGLLPPGNVPDRQKEQIQKTMWAPAYVLERKAKAAGVDKERTAQLMFKFQEAQVLAQKYLPTLLDKVKATDQEIDAYIAQHPELQKAAEADEASKRELRSTAEGVYQRLLAGEDFAALAKQYSGDPGSKEKGGELDWFRRGMMVKPFEEIAFAQKPGEISKPVETQFGYHIIQTEEKRTVKGDDGKDVEEVRARHILFTAPDEAGGRPKPAPREQAKAAVEKEKREKLIDEIVARQKVTVADDFKVEAPPAPPAMPQGGLPGEELGPPPGAGGEAPPAPVSPHGGGANKGAANSNKK